jgi:hypothetical protein
MRKREKRRNKIEKRNEEGERWKVGEMKDWKRMKKNPEKSDEVTEGKSKRAGVEQRDKETKDSEKRRKREKSGKGRKKRRNIIEEMRLEQRVRKLGKK